MFSVVLPKTPAGLLNLCPYLSIHYIIWLAAVDIKIDSQPAAKKVLHLAENLKILKTHLFRN